MGRIKTQLVKRVTKQLLASHEQSFTEDFVKNKEVLNTLAKFQSSKIRNTVAGYLTRLVRMHKKTSQ